MASRLSETRPFTARPRPLCPIVPFVFLVIRVIMLSWSNRRQSEIAFREAASKMNPSTVSVYCFCSSAKTRSSCVVVVLVFTHVCGRGGAGILGYWLSFEHLGISMVWEIKHGACHCQKDKISTASSIDKYFPSVTCHAIRSQTSIQSIAVRGTSSILCVDWVPQPSCKGGMHGLKMWCEGSMHCNVSWSWS